MLKIRKKEQRGHSQIDWLDSWHSFSFAGFYDPDYVNFGPLRVLNDDIIMPGRGFGTHPHQDMEIISYVLEGALEHKDSMQNGGVIRAGDVQRMSAGSGITHSEFNHSKTEHVHFLQVWFLPDQHGHTPAYEQKHFSPEDKRGRLRLVASANGEQDSVSLNQDVNFYAGLIDGDEQIRFEVNPERYVWIQIARGSVSVNGHVLSQGDGASITEAGTVKFDSGHDAEIVVFDMTQET